MSEEPTEWDGIDRRAKPASSSQPEPAVLIEGSEVPTTPPHVMVPATLPTTEQTLRAEVTAGATLKLVIWALAAVAVIGQLGTIAIVTYAVSNGSSALQAGMLAALISPVSAAIGSLSTLVARVGRLNGQGIG